MPREGGGEEAPLSMGRSHPILGDGQDGVVRGAGGWLDGIVLQTTKTLKVIQAHHIKIRKLIWTPPQKKKVTRDANS